MSETHADYQAGEVVTPLLHLVDANTGKVLARGRMEVTRYLLRGTQLEGEVKYALPEEEWEAWEAQ